LNKSTNPNSMSQPMIHTRLGWIPRPANSVHGIWSLAPGDLSPEGVAFFQRHGRLDPFSREQTCVNHAGSGLGGPCAVNGNIIHPITGAVIGQTPRRQVQTGTPPAVAPCPFYPHISCLFALTFPSQAARSTSKIRVVPACSLE
jgi:hypothetical protein